MRRDDEPLLSQAPPHSLEAEEAVLGAILFDPNALDEIVDLVAAGDFYRSAYGVVFGAALEMRSRREPVDLLTLTAILRTRGVLAEIGGATFLAGLLERTPTAANVKSYAKIVADLATQRRLIDASLKNLRDAYRPCADVRELLATAEQRIAEVGDDSEPESGTIDEAIARAKAVITTRDTFRIPTGYPFVDESIGGFKRASQWVIAGRPGSMKSVVASDISFAAAYNGIGSIVLSLENTREQHLLRRVAKDLGIQNFRLQHGFTHKGYPLLTPEEVAAAQAKLDEYARLPLWIFDDVPLWPVMVRRIERLKRLYPHIGQIVIDHVRLCRVPHLRADQVRERIAAVSGWGMTFCKEAKVNVVLVSQLNRESEKQNREPMLSDLAECGNLEQDAHGVIFTHRPERDSSGETDEEFIMPVLKNRDGPISRFRMRAIRQYCRVLDPLEERERSL